MADPALRREILKVLFGAEGGRARAKNLTKEERSEIARRAAIPGFFGRREP
jgi:hypothetical protein